MHTNYLNEHIILIICMNINYLNTTLYFNNLDRTKKIAKYKNIVENVLKKSPLNIKKKAGNMNG